MRLQVKEVVGTLDAQILAVVDSGRITQPEIVGVLAPKIFSPFQDVYPGRRDADTVRNHIRDNLAEGFLLLVSGNLSVAPKGMAVLQALRENGAINGQMPPRVVGVIGYTPKIQTPQMIWGSLIFIGTTRN